MDIRNLAQEIATDDLRQALFYWEKCCQGAMAPSRNDIDLLEIPKLLLRITIIDVIDGGRDFVPRYIGRNITLNQTLKTDKSISEMPLSEGRQKIEQRYRLVLEKRRPVYHRYMYTNILGNSRMTETVCCPLSDDGETINKLFNVGADLGLKKPDNSQEDYFV